MVLRPFVSWRLISHCCSARWAKWAERGPCMGMVRSSSDMAEFRKVFSKAKHIVVITGAGVSAESGVPTFRGAAGYWRKWQAQDLATPEAFFRNPSRVWEYYHYRRELMFSKSPNAAHVALAECEARLSRQGRSIVVISQSIDELHCRAGSQHVLKIHGSLFETRCVRCGDVVVNRKSPICAALEGKGSPDPNAEDADIPVELLPRCEKSTCNGLLRPSVIWFGETLNSDILTQVEKELDICDLCLVVGTSSIVYPAAMFAPQVASRGIPVAEFNLRTTPSTTRFRYKRKTKCVVKKPVRVNTCLLRPLPPHWALDMNHFAQEIVTEASEEK